jgi:hypothetical protein
MRGINQRERKFMVAREDWTIDAARRPSPFGFGGDWNSVAETIRFACGVEPF